MGRLKDLIAGLSREKRRKIVMLAGIAVIALLFLSTLSPAEEASEQAQSYSAEEISRLEGELEQRLTEIISEISGVDSPRVMITLECTEQKLYATETKSENTSGEAKSESSLALSGSSKDALETAVICPRVRGVAIVCGGADNALVREAVANTAARVLDVGVSRVYVASSG